MVLFHCHNRDPLTDAMLTQYIIIAEDLLEGTPPTHPHPAEWGTGPTIAQAAHAVTACLAKHWANSDTQAYVSPDNIRSMRKVVLKASPHIESFLQ
jgi:hypothetical protein